MGKNTLTRIWELIGLRYKSHPWHGVQIGEEAPDLVTSFIEVVPSDTVKYEVDKRTGYLKVDRPQKFSNIVPALYGFLPQTYCMDQVAEYCMEKTGKTGIVGDGDPLDICVLTERNITHGDLLVPAVPIGGFRMIDGGEADDKIIAILKGDQVYEDWKDITDCPAALVERLKHYFLTYKQMPGSDEDESRIIEITDIYGREEALEVIRRSMVDYRKKFGKLENRLSLATLEMINFGQSWQEAMREADGFGS
ncbi:inorganic pyrophosphatase [Pontibacter sp. G13]|uniref:inorganic pyrophosphatase n=1 Tax=Pontibacter sp. G13 TaxID=3074898 RepID=UPI00288A52CF|nr:inorganic pyrophosphatase [Pontibacter sp. G13]WNJ19809.1 inorganic pyrophosphatase [Pontibacter sp. G13]